MQSYSNYPTFFLSFIVAEFSCHYRQLVCIRMEFGYTSQFGMISEPVSDILHLAEEQEIPFPLTNFVTHHLLPLKDRKFIIVPIISSRKIAVNLKICGVSYLSIISSGFLVFIETPSSTISP